MKKFTCIFVLLCMVISGTCICPENAQANTAGAAAKDMANVVLFANFQDSLPSSGSGYSTDFFNDNLTSIMNEYEGADNPRSFKSYIDIISYGQLQVHNVFPQYDGNSINAVTLPYTMQQALESNIDTQIIDYVLAQVSMGADITDYDGDGYIDNLTVILNGCSDEVSSDATLVSHKSDYTGSLQINGKYIGTYNMLNANTIFGGVGSSGAGVIAHEFLHSIGYQDLYPAASSDEKPVHVWDIMASANYGMPWPLAYLRMYYTNWITIDTVTESCDLVLDKQSNKDGNQAYILKSPLNEQEFFVIEYRQKGNIYAEGAGALDRNVGYSGVIVYRIDTTVERLSNHFGETGVYVFRPQGDAYSDESYALYCAAIADNSDTAQLNSIGTEDMTKGLADGALTFSDGTNSGIVVSTTSDGTGDTMNVHVEFPELSASDMWENTCYPEASGSGAYDGNVAACVYEGAPVVAQYYNNTLSFRRYENNVWSSFAADISGVNYNSYLQLLECGDELYALYTAGTYSASLYIAKYNSSVSGFETVAVINDVGASAHGAVVDGKLYVAYATGDSRGACLGYYSGSTYTALGQFCGNGSMFYGQPMVSYVDDCVYVAVRNASTNMVELYQNSGNTFTQINFGYTVQEYTMSNVGDRLWLVVQHSAGTSIHVYDGDAWTDKELSTILYNPQITGDDTVQYILSNTGSMQGKSRVYKYDLSGNTLTAEGIDVDGAYVYAGINLQGETAYVALVRSSDKKLVVKRKEVEVGSGNQTPTTPTDPTTPTNPTTPTTPVIPTRITAKNNKIVIDSSTIKKITVGTTAGNLLGNVNESAYCKIYKGNRLLSASEKLGTGMTIKLMDGNTVRQSLSLVVAGDVNGDAAVTITDMISVKSHILKKQTLTGIYAMAADINGDNTISITDFIQIKAHILGK